MAKPKGYYWLQTYIKLADGSWVKPSSDIRLHRDDPRDAMVIEAHDPKLGHTKWISPVTDDCTVAVSIVHQLR